MKVQGKSEGVDRFLRTVAMVGLYAGLLTPVIFFPLFRFAFIALKVFWLQTVVGLSFPAFLILAWRNPKFRPPRTWVLLALMAHLAAISLSVVFGQDPTKGFWGTLVRMNGLWSLLHFAAWSIMAMGLLHDWPAWRRLIRTALGIALCAGCITALQIPFPAILGVLVDIRVSGVFGNPIFSAAYHGIILFLLAFLWSKDGIPARRFLALDIATGAVSFLALVTSGSRGPLLGLVCGLIVATLFVGLLGGRRKQLLALLGILSAFMAIYLTIALAIAPRPGMAAFWARHTNLQHLFLLKDNAGRFHSWALALEGIAEHPILGWGQANYEGLYDRHYRPREYGSGGMDDAHNFVLQALATNGVVGLATFLGLWGCVCLAIYRACKRGEINRLSAGLLVGLPTAHLVQGMFNPESPGTLFLCHVLFALAARLEHPTPEAFPVPRWRPSHWFLIPAGLMSAVAVLYGSVYPAMASHTAIIARKAHNSGASELSWRLLRKSASYPSPYHEERFAQEMGLLIHVAENHELDRLPDWRRAFADERRFAEAYFSKHRLMILELAYAHLVRAMGEETKDEGLLREAEARFVELQKQHPRRQEVLFDRAMFLTKQGRLDEAEKLYRAIHDDEPRVGESAYQLGRFLFQHRNRSVEGLKFIAEGARAEVPYPGKNFEELAGIAGACARVKDQAGLRAIVSLSKMIPPGNKAKSYVTIAEYLEDAGLLDDRNAILRMGSARLPEVAERAAPVLARQRPLKNPATPADAPALASGQNVLVP